MSEIEKMYENAEVLKECLSPCYINKTWRKAYDCPNCNNRENYPPFTAEKQIELIKWLVCTGEEIRISGHRKGNLYWMSTDVDNKEQESTFEETLAKIINNLWQYLTVEERKQIKEILE